MSQQCSRDSTTRRRWAPQSYRDSSQIDQAKVEENQKEEVYLLADNSSLLLIIKGNNQAQRNEDVQVPRKAGAIAFRGLQACTTLQQRRSAKSPPLNLCTSLFWARARSRERVGRFSSRSCHAISREWSLTRCQETPTSRLVISTVFRLIPQRSLIARSNSQTISVALATRKNAASLKSTLKELAKREVRAATVLVAIASPSLQPVTTPVSSGKPTTKWPQTCLPPCRSQF